MSASRVPVPVVSLSRIDTHAQKQTQGASEQMPVASFAVLACIIPLRPPFSVVVTDWLSAWQRAAPPPVPMHGTPPFGAHQCTMSRSRPAAGDERKNRPSAVAGCREEASARRTHVTRWRRWHAPSRGRNAPDSAPDVKIWMVIPSLSPKGSLRFWRIGDRVSVCRQAPGLQGNAEWCECRHAP